VLRLRERMSTLPIVGLSVSVIPSELPKLGAATLGLALTQVFPNAQWAWRSSGPTVGRWPDGRVRRTAIPGSVATRSPARHRWAR
jgi:hypothetical protein